VKNLTWQNPEQLIVAQELIIKVKMLSCGIKVQEDAVQKNQNQQKFVVHSNANENRKTLISSKNG